MKTKNGYRVPCLGVMFVFLLQVSSLNAATLDELFKQYQQQGASAPNVNNGETLWNKSFSSDKLPHQRSCNSCHTQDLYRDGLHAKTRKAIKPMAPSVNPERLTDRNKIEKWLKRNCMWTLGRECSAQEKSDVLAYIRSQ